MYRIVDPKYTPAGGVEYRYNAETRRFDEMPIMFVRFEPRPGVLVKDMEEAKRVHGGYPVLEVAR